MEVKKTLEGGRRSAARKKLWQMEQGYHCSVVGICLSRNDLRALAQRKSYGIRRGANDFEIHQQLSATASLRSAQSRALHKMLDQKYRLAIQRYDRCPDSDAIEAQWQEDLRAGRVAGAYWAIMTSGISNSQLLDQVYGDCHMVSFETFGSQSQDNRKMQELRAKLVKLDALMEESQLLLAEERGRASRLEHTLQQERCEKQELEELNSRLAADNTLLEEQAAVAVPSELERLRGEFALLKQQNATLQAKNKKISTELQLLKSKEESSRTERRNQQARIQQLATENHSLKEEYAALEAMVRNDDGAISACHDCDGQLTGQCQWPDLCGKTILYVGGRHGMISRYRELVENRGGTFLHHDGGRENSRQLLPKMLSGADAVLCPIDCISHDACNRVKKVCKKYQKPFVMMRSSGLSSLARGLGTIQT
mgnify:CR=1 FL=1